MNNQTLEIVTGEDNVIRKVLVGTEAPFTPPVKPVEHIELTLNINKDS